MDVKAIHAQHLPKTIDFTDVLEELKSTLKGTWQYSSPGHFAYALSNPVFTVNGDLILQLGSYDAIMKKEIAPQINVIGSPRTPQAAKPDLAVGGGLEVATTTSTGGKKTVRKSRSILSRTITSVKTSVFC